MTDCRLIFKFLKSGLYAQHHGMRMDIRIRKGFKLAGIEAHRENRGKNGGHLAL